MASITANGSKGHHKFTLTVSESSYSVANNTSSVSFSFQLSPIQTSWDWALWGDKISYSITINGTSYTGTIPDYDGSSTVTLKSGSLTVAHNSDGTKSISYSFSVTDSTGQTYTPGNASASGTMTLTTIPRATTPTVSATSVTMGSSITITMTPASTTFKHKIRYNFVNVTNSVVGLSIGDAFTATGTTTATLTPPTSLGSQIPNTTSGVMSIICYTYTSSGSHIGTTTIKVTVNVPSYNPVISSIALTGNNLLSSTYVQGKSTVTPKITASTSYGATITAYSSTVDGKTYTGQTFTTSVLSNGTKTVKTTITDSRGKTVTTESSSFVVYAYSNPYITTFTLARQTDGTTVIATLVGGVASVNGKNAKTFSVTLNGVTKAITSTTNTVNGTATFTGISTDTTFEATAIITDSYTSVTMKAVLPTVAVTMDFYKDGNGIAMGKVSEQGDLLDVAWSGRVRKNLTVDGTLTVSGKTLDTMIGATDTEAGSSGTVPVPDAGDQDKVLHGDGTWRTPESTFTADITPVSVKAPTAVNLTANKIFYYVMADMDTVSVTYDSLPNGWVGFLTIYNLGGYSFSSTAMATTSINGVTQTALGDMSGSCISMVIFKYGGSRVLRWFVFKS